MQELKTKFFYKIDCPIPVVYGPINAVTSSNKELHWSINIT